MKIRVYNVADSETLSYHLPLLTGGIEGVIHDGEVEVWNTSDAKRKCIIWPVIEGAFKVLVKLKPGENIISLRYQDEVLKTKLIFEVPPFKRFIRPLYIVCAGHDGHFQGPDDEDCSIESALCRITLGAMLIQTFTAEKMREHGFGRRTFQLELGEDYEPVCHILHSKLTVEEAHSMLGNELWIFFAKELMASDFARKEYCKWYCFMSFTRYHPPQRDIPKTHSEILKYTKGHTALGGGGLALFGTGNLHTWACSVDEIYRRFTNCCKIDRSKLMDDSAYREYHWANYATGLGASLHELGHTFDLAHTPSGIMARGFDDLHKVFTVERSKVGSDTKEIYRYRSKESLHRPTSGSDLESSPEGPIMESHARRYRDVCYGSPFKKVSESSAANNSAYSSPLPLVVSVESGFKSSHSHPSMTFSLKNYDGSETHKVINMDHGCETITEMTLASDGRLLGKISRRERKSSTCSNASSTSTQSPSSGPPTPLPSSPEEPDLRLPPVHFMDDGAHWFRSSAVVLRFHKWFNAPDSADPKRAPVLSGCKIRSSCGLRLVELRSDPEGVVFHHWEFLKPVPHADFTLKLSRIKNLPENAQSVTVLAEDNYGNILKKKMKVDQFQT